MHSISSVRRKENPFCLGFSLHFIPIFQLERPALIYKVRLLQWLFTSFDSELRP